MANSSNSTPKTESMNVRVFKGLLLLNGISLDEINEIIKDCSTDNSRTAKLKNVLEERNIDYPSNTKVRKSNYPTLDVFFGKTIAEKLKQCVVLCNTEKVDCDTFASKQVSQLSPDEIKLLIKHNSYLEAHSKLDTLLNELQTLGVTLNFDTIQQSIHRDTTKKPKDNSSNNS